MYYNEEALEIMNEGMTGKLILKAFVYGILHPIKGRKPEAQHTILLKWVKSAKTEKDITFIKNDLRASIASVEAGLKNKNLDAKTIARLKTQLTWIKGTYAKAIAVQSKVVKQSLKENVDSDMIDIYESLCEEFEIEK